MAYQALYRKWRPDGFDDVKGQEPIVTALRNQIIQGRIGHAYLFCGTRGTGKTSVAKIFAKAVNCEHPVNGSPCGECESCRAIAQQRSMNVVEIDAASNNGVDNIRQICEETAYHPAEGRYKVYIIDEVHMLTASAFNALLKTLEEPPEYVIFILATTEPQSVLPTIISRCQRYDFRRLSIPTIVDRMRFIADQENIDVDDEALEYIARTAGGAMRDALSIFDQCQAFCLGEKITYQRVADVLGAVDPSVLADLMRDIAHADADSALRRLNDMILQGRDLTQVVSDLIWYLRNLMLVKAGIGEDMIEASHEQVEAMKKAGEDITEDMILYYIRVLSDLYNSMRRSSQKRVLVEVAIIRLCHPAAETDLDALRSRVDILEERLDSGQFAAPAGQPAGAAQKPAPAAPESGAKEQDLLEALPEDIMILCENWEEIRNSLPEAPRRMLQGAAVSPVSNGIMLYIQDKFGRYYFEHTEKMRELTEMIAQKTGRKFNIHLADGGVRPDGGSNAVSLDRIVDILKTRLKTPGQNPDQEGNE
ncbi:MAG: DNA polymerase III subunit gamma/tau [Lachnospiraceae bacterium]|jgi:DNA polymerase-3 subunit gamma/tau